MNTVLEIVNEARRRTKNGPIPADQLNEYQGTYDLILGDLLEERSWLFTINITERLTTTTDGADLGYTNKYILPTDAIDVMDIDDGNFQEGTASIREGLRAGVALDHPSDRAISYTAHRQFVFLNGILHTDSQPRRIVYRQRITPDRMPYRFKRLLVLALAIQFERDFNGDPNHIASLRSELKQQYVRATRQETQRPHDPYLQGIYDWLIEYEANSRLGY